MEISVCPLLLLIKVNTMILGIPCSSNLHSSSYILLYHMFKMSNLAKSAYQLPRIWSLRKNLYLSTTENLVLKIVMLNNRNPFACWLVYFTRSMFYAKSMPVSKRQLWDCLHYTNYFFPSELKKSLSRTKNARFGYTLLHIYIFFFIQKKIMLPHVPKIKGRFLSRI